MPLKGNVIPFRQAAPAREIEKRWLVPESFGATRSLIPVRPEKQASLGLRDPEARHFTPELAAFVNSIERNPNYSWLIVIPIGVGEIWGVNFRSDVVYRNELVPDITLPEYVARPYGYPTFRTAYMYKEHANKPQDGHPILGDVPFVTFNPKMQWVETVVRAFLPAVEQYAPDRLQRIQSGQFPMSMGLMALADVCLHCGNVRNKPDSKLCQCCTSQKNGGYLGRIYGDGTVGGMANIRPRFVDLSDVLRNADTLAWTTMKVASLEEKKPLGAKWTQETIRVALRNMQSSGLLQKAGAVPRASNAEIEKVSKTVRKALDVLQKEEPDINPAELCALGKEHGQSMIDGLASGGVLLRPHEFQMAHLGVTNPALAASTLASRQTFPMLPTDVPDFAAALAQPFTRPSPGITIWVRQNIMPWKSWSPQPLLYRLTTPPPVLSPMVEPSTWSPVGEGLGDVKSAYLMYLAQALAAVFEQAARYTGPQELSMEGDKDMRALAKEASLGPLAAALPALYFAKLFHNDMLGQAMQLGTGPGIVPAQPLPERTMLEKLIMFNPALATNFIGISGRVGTSMLDKLDDILLRRLVR